MNQSSSGSAASPRYSLVSIPSSHTTSSAPNLSAVERYGGKSNTASLALYIWIGGALDYRNVFTTIENRDEAEENDVSDDGGWRTLKTYRPLDRFCPWQRVQCI